MNRKQISALLVLHELGINHRMLSFSERLSVQKAIYLAQAAGVDVGHYFNWYLRGPYAPSLTKDVFDAIQNHDVPAVLEDWELDQGTRTKLERLRGQLTPPASMEQPAWLELLASVHFLVDRDQVASADADVVRAQLVKYKKDFTKKQVSEALRRLRTAELLPKST